MLRVGVVAALAFIFSAGAANADGVPPSATARLWLLPFDPNAGAAFELNEKRNVLFVATNDSVKRASPGGNVAANAYIAAYDLSEPGIPVQRFRVTLGDVSPGHIFPRFGRLFVSI